MRRALVVLLMTAPLLLNAAASRAEFQWPPPKDVSMQYTNETGVTVGEIVHERLWSMVRHPLSSNALTHVGEVAHRAPHRGIEFELLTPGDVGATIHFRW